MSTIFDFDIVTCRYTFNSIRGIHQQFTVEYAPSLKVWFVFKDDMSTDCVFKIKHLGKPPKKNSITIEAAEDILNQYLDTIPVTVV